jgi:hypothetical protein
MNLEKVEEKQALVVTEAESLVVLDKAGADEAASVGRQVKSLKEEVKSAFRPIIAAAHNAHREALAQEKKYLEPLEKAEKILKDKILGWQQLERLRAEAEAKRKELEEKRRREAEAEKLADEGKDEEALKVLEEAEDVVYEAEAEKVTGAQVRKNMDVEVDIEQLIKAVHEGRAPLSFLAPNPTAIRAIVRSMDEKTFAKQFAGCGLRLYDKGSVAFR